MKEQNIPKEECYFSTALPVVTDDDGYLGYLWKGIIFTRRGTTEDFIPAFKTGELYDNPEQAIGVAEDQADKAGIIKRRYSNI